MARQEWAGTRSGARPCPELVMRPVHRLPQRGCHHYPLVAARRRLVGPPCERLARRFAPFGKGKRNLSPPWPLDDRWQLVAKLKALQAPFAFPVAGTGTAGRGGHLGWECPPVIRWSGVTGGAAENCEATSAIPGHRQPETATCLLQQTARRRDAEVVASIVMVICFANRHYALLRLLHFFSSRSLTNMPVSDSAAVKQIRGKEIILKKNR
jgi:hypothetical protein